MHSPLAGETEQLLKQVSRSFYLTLRILPAPVRPQIGLAYLLARTTDTIADTHLVPVKRRLSALREMRAVIVSTAAGRTVLPPEFGELAAAQPVPAGRGSGGERALLQMTGNILETLRSFDKVDRQSICELLHTITYGQEKDLERFGDASAADIRALKTEEELDEYTYCVAGCVGEFWTRMCFRHLFGSGLPEDVRMQNDGIRFGKGLQLVNILRDLPADLRQGRCYIPKDRLSERRIAVHDLLSPSAIDRFRPLYDEYLRRARDLLFAGWNYTDAIPRSQMRVRLACAWPILIGLKTLTRLRSGNVLDNSLRIRVTRPEIRGLVIASVLRYPFAASWYGLFDRTAKAK